MAVTVCEDVWVRGGPAVRAAGAGAALVLSINASPFHAGKQVVREEMLTERVAESATPIAYLNLVGGQDDLVFDGGSVVIGPTAPSWPVWTASPSRSSWWTSRSIRSIRSSASRGCRGCRSSTSPDRVRSGRSVSPGR